MSKVLLISANEIKNFTHINYNVNDDYLSSTINVAQEVYLQEIIGTALLKRYKQFVTDTYNYRKGETSLYEKSLDHENNANYNDFYENFIKNYLKEQVESSLLFNLNFKIRNAGVVKNDKAISGEELGRMITAQNDVVAHWATMLSKYLQDADFEEIKNCDTYPAYYIKAKLGKDYGNVGLWLGSEK